MNILRLPDRKALAAEQPTGPLPLPEQETLRLPAVQMQPPFFRGSLPLPPSVNEAYKVVRLTTQGRQIHRIGPSQALEQFKRDAGLLLPGGPRTSVNWDVLSALRVSPRKTPLSVCIRAYFASAWRRDLDGIIKHSLDATFEFLCLNDNQVVRLVAEKLVDAQEPRVEIEVAVLVRRER